MSDMSEKLRRKLEKNLAALQGPEWNSEDEEDEEVGQPANNSRKRVGNQAKGGTGRKTEPGPVRKKRYCVVFFSWWCSYFLCRVSSQPAVIDALWFVRTYMSIRLSVKG